MNGKVYIILTSDGKRIHELNKLAISLNYFENCRVIFVNQSSNEQLVENIFRENNIDYDSIHIGSVIPLSKARNIALRHIKETYSPEVTDKILFSDDDCHYSKEFSSYVNNSSMESISICPVVSDDSFERFTSRGVKKLFKSGEMHVRDVMFYACSIAIVFPYKYIFEHEFNEKLGLGNIINQGEETDFLEQVILKHNPKILYKHDCMVYHPRKKDYSTQVFFSLSYFLSGKIINSELKGMYTRYALFFYFKYIVIFGLLILNSRKRAIFFASLKGVFFGVKDVYSIYTKLS